MAIFDLYSKRQKELRGEINDVFTYDEIPQSLRVQIVHIWYDSLGTIVEYDEFKARVRNGYTFIVQTLCREYGLFQLNNARNQHGRNYLKELVDFFLQESNTEKILDVIELSFKYVDAITREYDYKQTYHGSKIADRAIEELNVRFREHALGFEYSDKQLIRIDSKIIHAEIVKPTLILLNDKQFAGAQQEFLKAHEHYRQGNNKEAMNDCLKAFESAMKAICDERKWKYAPNTTSKGLIQVCFDNGLIPKFWDQQFTSLRSILESGVPTGRNKLSGHGQGSEPLSVPIHLVAYMLHMTASTLLFLAEADKATK